MPTTLIRLFSSLTALVALVASQAPRAANEPQLLRDTLAPGITLIRAPSTMDLWTSSNAVVIENDADLTVFDNNARPSSTRKLIAEIRKLSSKPVRTLINSHWHMDHWSGNAEFAKAWPGVEIIATQQTRAYMGRMGPGFFVDQLAGGVIAARKALEESIKSGKKADGSAFTAEDRAASERELTEVVTFSEELASTPRVLPTLAFRDTMSFWRGKREYRLLEMTGDATGSAVLFLPRERILVTGDVVVTPEEGDGPPPWTTNSNAITPWLESLRTLLALDPAIIVPGQGPALRDQSYLKLSIELYETLIAQVHAALEGGAVSLDEVQQKIDVDAIGRRYTPGASAPGVPFQQLVKSLVKKIFQESLDGAGREKARTP